MKCTPNVGQKSSMFGGAFFMTKYSHELRIKIVQEMEKGKTATGMAKEYGIPRKVVRSWWANYCESGIEGLISVKKKYTAEFKLHAIEFRWAHELSYLHTAAQLGIANEGILFSWEKKYLEYGVEALQDTKKGRPPKVPKQPPPKKPLTHEEILEERIKQLEMENAYLKKLNALVAEREKSKKKTK
jgi:transposase-like protein